MSQHFNEDLIEKARRLVPKLENTEGCVSVPVGQGGSLCLTKSDEILGTIYATFSENEKTYYIGVSKP